MTEELRAAIATARLAMSQTDPAEDDAEDAVLRVQMTTLVDAAESWARLEPYLGAILWALDIGNAAECGRFREAEAAVRSLLHPVPTEATGG